MSEPDDKPLPAAVAGAITDAIAPVVPDAHAAARIKRRLLERVRGDDAAADLVTVSGTSDDWIETSPGNQVKVLRSDDESMSILVRLEPGTTFPAHYHPVEEETYVVEGETYFGDIHLKAGDYHVAPQGSSHGEVRTETGCVLLIRKGPD
ncbi:MAG: cupin domain-containing protein [Pseudomonadota bacterium]